MNVVGLITEYNPFHKGHEYHIRKAKELTGADVCVVIMSGNYVQRGTPAFIDKHTRTRIALNHGADVVFELPLPFACSSAEYFATAAVTLLEKLGIINHICFGSECQDISKLNHIASILVDAKNNSAHELNLLIKENVKAGLSYASARSTALSVYLSEDCSSILDMPNNILAIEYLKALKILNSTITPIAIARANAAYHDNDENHKLYSASSVRSAITSSYDNSNINNDINIMDELYSFDIEYKNTLGKTAPITENDFSSITSEKLLSACLHGCTDSTLVAYMGIDNDLANRMSDRDILYTHTCYSDLIDKLKTKNIAYTSISRALLAITLGIYKSDITSYIDNGISSYIRLLGFNRASSAILNEIKKNGELTIIGQLSEINNNLSLQESDKRMLEHSLYCDELYNMIARSKYNAQIPNEFTRKITIL